MFKNVDVTDEDNTEEVISAIEAGAEKGLRDITNSTSEAIDSGFDTGHDALGRPWTPLQPETIRRKGHSQILVEHGTMRESQYNTVNSSTNSSQIGFTDGKIRYHEFGAPDVNLPARPVLQPAHEYSKSISRWKMEEAFDETFSTRVR